MSKAQVLRSLVKQRLTAAAEEIFGLFETTIAEYEEELCRSKEENERKQKLLDDVLNPELLLDRADIQQVLMVKEDVPSDERQSNLDQEDQEPRNIKEEQEDLWTSQEGEQLQGLEEADVMFTTVPVKSEYNEEEPQSSWLCQRQTEQMENEDHGEDWGGPEAEAASCSDPNRHPVPDTFKTGDASETDASDDWKETREPQSGLNSLTDSQTSVPVSGFKFSVGEKLFSCSECGKRFGTKRSVKRHVRTHSQNKPYSCSVCKKSFSQSGILLTHMRTHTGEKPYSCSVCKKTFTQSGSVQAHMRTHTGEKPFSCSVCEKRFSNKEHLKIHMRTHTENKPFSCSLCNRSFTQRGSLQTHMRVHTGEKPYSCSICQKSFTQSGSLSVHMKLHAKTFQLLDL
ncbi:zinc finger protein 32-like [Centropristis striata]|uniref:zinc finger protein 32-like n=1 Tax=Centropristis striata TaxID=184440 RepID=UPI0027E025A8|nr:zinc finger protein 32-like [Centropristis striata]